MGGDQCLGGDIQESLSPRFTTRKKQLFPEFTGGHHASSRAELTNASLIPSLQIEVRPMMYVALTYDHRLIDGREAVTFLRKIKAAVEDPRVLLLDL